LDSPIGTNCGKQTERVAVRGKGAWGGAETIGGGGRLLNIAKKKAFAGNRRGGNQRRGMIERKILKRRFDKKKVSINGRGPRQSIPERKKGRSRARLYWKRGKSNRRAFNPQKSGGIQISLTLSDEEGRRRNKTRKRLGGEGILGG